MNKYSTRNTVDVVALIGELEHTRRHALRAFVAASNEEDKERALTYQMFVDKAQRLRRELTEKNFPDLTEKDWCLVKVAACLRQLNYETFTGNTEALTEIDGLVDEILELATGEDLSGCATCRDDRSTLQAQPAIEELSDQDTQP